MASDETGGGLGRVLDGIPGGRIELGQVMDRLGERVYGAAYLFLALPNLVPVPIVPGSTTITGVALMVVAAQEMAGREAPWLPARLRALALDRAVIQEVLERLDRLLTHPSPRLAANPARAPLHAAAVLLLGAVLALPIPLANLLPALAICAFGAGLLAGDARALAVGWTLTALMGLLAAGFGALLAGLTRAS
jgi:hypothetical protein